MSEGAEGVRLLAGIAGILAGGEDLVVEGGVAVAGGDRDGGVGQERVEGLVLVAGAA